MQLNYAGRPFYQLGIAGFKAALCINYLHLLAKTSKRFYRMLVWGVILLTTLGHVAGTLVLILNCKPVGCYSSAPCHEIARNGFKSTDRASLESDHSW